ncbi:UbiE/COQ5 methyltransferase [Crateriforma conspicua]|uniref:Demethylmenaquinone methyltransferase n=2 Tax=Crateriforma TaxID=2714592 RepID=A0A5C5Y6W5_9PLAN|nr:UbiE/COQ5 methyltransferase [Crateriforma conspicua]TWT70503.1 UbiE/COQ5 methyltransferase [Crateriforma conspicua]
MSDAAFITQVFLLFPIVDHLSQTSDSSTVDKSGDRVREMFRQIAPRYDRMNHLLSLNIDRYWRWRTVRKMDFQPTRPVLDVCTGTGDLALSIARKVPHGVRVFGSDFCNAMLRIATDKNAEPEGPVKPVRFLEADAQALPFESDRFQYVTVAFGLRNVADTDRGLQEMTRVCAPGGHVVVLEFSKPRIPVLKQIYGFYFSHVLPRIGQWMARNNQSAYEYLPESVGHFPSGPDLLKHFTAAGLTDVRYTPLTLGVASIYIGRKPDS